MLSKLFFTLFFLLSGLGANSSEFTKLCIASDVDEVVPKLRFILSDIYNDIGIKVSVRALPSARMIKDFRSGDCDSIAILSKVIEGDEFIFVGDPVFGQLPYGLWKRKDSHPVDIKKAKIIRTRGNIYADYYMAKFGYKNAVESIDIPNGFTLLEKGRGDFLIAAQTSIIFAKDKDKFVFVEDNVEKLDLYHVIGRKISRYEKSLAVEIKKRIDKGAFAVKNIVGQVDDNYIEYYRNNLK
ncbi:hypothetical protein [Bacteriovorax sp. BSW11_IV]|uniref:hypothetical protein n=1 Tax=Bacteriovorax sp. BSW11_IV TaxID=1353529 RepID=UPI0004162690|nr:hypothetical protein [Bacteriovorax sp. BSW11_IV]